jgi:osmotically-inducible protein OsmY
VTNEELQLAVIDELRWDTKIDSEWDEVPAHDGTVTLRGAVGSHRQKREASRVAHRVQASPTSSTTWMCRSSAHCGGRTITCFGTCCRP